MPRAAPPLAALVAAGDRASSSPGRHGDLHFAADLRNAGDCATTSTGWRRTRSGTTSSSGIASASWLLEEVFHHAEFTGRSGTFFAFEGLGSIYWHMVSKLLLAVQETLGRAVREEADPDATAALRDRYDDIRAGLGFYKTPGGVRRLPHRPLLPHARPGTARSQPGHDRPGQGGGADPPGRGRDRVEDGRIVIRPTLLRSSEWTAGATFAYRDLAGHWVSIEVPADSFAVTFCQVPVVVHRSDRLAITAHLVDGTEVSGTDGILDVDISASVFRRDGRVRLLEVWVPGAGA